MIKTRFQWTILLVVSALLGTGWIFYSREPVIEERFTSLTEAPIVGYLAPNFTLSTPGGQAVTLSDYVAQESTAGKPVVLNFWASWCAPCRIEMPHFQNASQKYGEQVAILGINQAESAEIVTDFGAEFDITYPLLVDADRSVNNQYAIINLPTTVFIDANGVVQEVLIGTVSQAVLEDRIEQLLAE